MLSKTSLALIGAAVVTAHSSHGPQSPISGPHQSLWYSTIPGDGGTQVRHVRGHRPGHLMLITFPQADSVFSGISTFGRLPYAQCLSPQSDAKYDIAFIGMPPIDSLKSSVGAMG